MLKHINTTTVSSNQINSVYVTFEIKTSDYDGTDLYAVFNRKYREPLDKDNTCLIPADVLQDNETIKIGLLGELEDYRINTNSVQIKLFKGY